MAGIAGPAEREARQASRFDRDWRESHSAQSSVRTRMATTCDARVTISLRFAARRRGRCDTDVREALIVLVFP